MKQPMTKTLEAPIDLAVRLNPDYEFHMEVLATLPLYPDAALHEHLRNDFGLKNQNPLHEALMRLGDTYSIQTWRESDNGERGRSRSAIRMQSWRLAQAAALEYWKVVHDA